jgi:hypothetical protein
MSRDDAMKHDPYAEPVTGSMEIRNLPESPDEWHSNSGWLRKT